ncbi:ARM repeat-containing protein [Testicularia cyperi]|uniref:ARM repeat-containing protein n=1 Tax=Testicularia cyperi TaxID=1882483 RepID=A0A317XXA1_9BASI|nr:ARM repeat-containing protein [Testicularia cyperi]
MPVAVASRPKNPASAGGRGSDVAAASAKASRDSLPKPAETNTTLIALHASIPPHFQQAQHSLANHRKNIVSLHRIHLKAATVTEKTPKGTRLVGEKAFNEVFFGCLDRVLPIKKGVANADRICKFVAAYATYAQEQFRLQARAERAQQRGNHEADEDEEEEDTPATRFTSLLLKHLLKGFASKNKNVRLRCCGCIALLINGLESLDEALFQTLKSFLLSRAKDKESSVRVQAVIALAKLQASEDDMEDDADGADDVRQVLIETLRFDSSAEVRRAALFNITATEETQPFLLERLRDVDPINRRCVYLGSLSMKLQTQIQAMQTGGAAAAAAGPSRLGLDMDAAGEVLRIGMGEREPSVKRAAKKLVTAWFDACGSDLVVFLNQFDVVSSKQVEAALQAIFESRPAIMAQVSFDAEEFWANLSPSTAFLARAFVDHFKRTGNERRLEECLPMVTALAFRIQSEYEALVKLIEQFNVTANSVLIPEEEQQIQLFTIRNKTFIVSQLLGIALASDFGDEIGRRKMFGLVRDMISDAELPEDLVPSCLDVLLKLSNGQRDFMRMIVEIVQVLGVEEDDDTFDYGTPSANGDGDDTTMSVDATPLARKKTRKSIRPRSDAAGASSSIDPVALETRRLVIVRAMLERVVGALQENTAFHGLIPQLIAPAVRSKDAAVRELGLACLALCCLLDLKLALESFPLFIDQVTKASGSIKLQAVQAVFDLLIVHTISVMCSRNQAGEEIASRQMIHYLLSLLEDDDAQIQSAACEGMAKLMLLGMVDDDEALKSLVLIYMSPETMLNQELRQCLSYFLPVYCGSSSWNQRRLQRVFVSVLQVLTEVHEEKEEDQEMVTPAQVGMQLLDWTDPDKVPMVPGRIRDETVHVDVAIDLIRALYTDDDKDHRKVMCQLLGKLYLPAELDLAKVQEVILLLTGLKKLNPIEDTVSKNALARFEAALAKAYPEQIDAGLADLDLEGSPVLADTREFFASIRVDPAQIVAAYVKSARKVSASAASAGMRKVSTASTRTSTSSRASPAPVRSAKSKARKNQSDDSDDQDQEEDDDDDDEEMDDDDD